MDFKISIKCMTCRCSFELRPGVFKIRDTLECPNCGQAFPQEFYEKIKTGVIALGEVPEWIPEKSESITEPENFLLKVSSFNGMRDVQVK